jgi:phenylpropionate dioxygenase-like ring-hydroxylating dioxygenase large terminal subunit
MDVSAEPWVERLRSSLRDGSALPAECYRDPALFELELERVLRPGWHAVARWDDLPEPGDYASLDLFGEPLLLVRDDARRLRLISRVCTHRAHVLVEGSGNARRFTCPYHRWAFERDGRLAAAPLMEDAPGFDRERCGLPEVRTEEWLGFVFACLDPDAPPLAPSLSVLEGELAPLGLAGFETAGILEFDSPWNWKVLVDNFMESYHHLGPHVESFQKTNRAQKTYCNGKLTGPFALLENPGQDDAPSFRVGHVFPTTLLAVYQGLPIGAWYEMRIDRHDHFHLRIHMLASPEMARDRTIAASLVETARDVHLEDIAVCDGVQRGIVSRLWRPGRLNPREGALVRFQQHLLGCLTD